MGHEKVLYGSQLIHHGGHLFLAGLPHLIANLVHMLFHLKKESEGVL